MKTRRYEEMKERRKSVAPKKGNRRATRTRKKENRKENEKEEKKENEGKEKGREKGEKVKDLHAARNGVTRNIIGSGRVGAGIVRGPTQVIIR